MSTTPTESTDTRKATLSSGVQVDPLLNIKDLAAYLGMSTHTLYKWAAAGKGPTCILIGNERRWRLSAVDAWLDANEAA